MTSAPSRRAPAPSITIQVQSPLWEAEPAAEQTVRDAIAAAAATLSTADNEVSILLTDDKAIRLLNREWRGIDKPTNVLAFPAPTTKAPAPLPLFAQSAAVHLRPGGGISARPLRSQYVHHGRRRPDLRPGTGLEDPRR